jgi:hypothetical protein
VLTWAANWADQEIASYLDEAGMVIDWDSATV